MRSENVAALEAALSSLLRLGRTISVLALVAAIVVPLLHHAGARGSFFLLVAIPGLTVAALVEATRYVLVSVLRAVKEAEAARA